MAFGNVSVSVNSDEDYTKDQMYCIRLFSAVVNSVSVLLAAVSLCFRCHKESQIQVRCEPGVTGLNVPFLSDLIQDAN